MQVLAERLLVGPPSLEVILGRLDQSEAMIEFRRIVREFLPDKEAEILSKPRVDQVDTFTGLFEQRYFPLHDIAMGEDEDFECLVAGIPVIRMGMSWDDYHEFAGFRPGIQLLLSVVECPFENYGCSIGRTGRTTVGSTRVPLLEGVAGMVGEKLMQRIPKEGWSSKELHRRLDNNARFKGAALYADWVEGGTDTVFLDTSYEIEVIDADWTREVVDELTEQWRRAAAIDEQVMELVKFLEDNPAENFEALLNALTTDPVPAEQQRLLVEIFAEEESDGGA